MPADIGSIIVPWVANLKLPHMYFVIPVVSTIIQLIPNILLACGMLKSLNMQKPTNAQMVMAVVVNLLFMSEAPVTIGIYWIASGLFGVLEQILYSIYARRKCLN